MGRPFRARPRVVEGTPDRVRGWDEMSRWDRPGRGGEGAGGRD